MTTTADRACGCDCGCENESGSVRLCYGCWMDRSRGSGPYKPRHREMLIAIAINGRRPLPRWAKQDEIETVRADLEDEARYAGKGKA